VTDARAPRRIRLTLDGAGVLARLLDERAPRTCERLWQILPFTDRVTHSRWAGGRFHTNRHPDLGIDMRDYPRVENPSSFQAPGDVVVFPVNGELAACYAPGAYQWMGLQWVASRIAVIEGDMKAFARAIERLQWEGAKELVIARAEAIGAVGAPAFDGPLIEIECDGRRWVGALFGHRNPRLREAIMNALPLSGPVTNMHSSGAALHFWADIPGIPSEAETRPERWPVDHEGRQIGSTGVAFHDPLDVRGTSAGDLIFHSVEGLRLVHGQVQVDQTHFSRSGLLAGYGWSVKVGRVVEGSLDELSALADRIEWEGAKVMRMRPARTTA
jgi:hypothetical protein